MIIIIVILILVIAGSWLMYQRKLNIENFKSKRPDKSFKLTEDCSNVKKEDECNKSYIVYVDEHEKQHYKFCNYENKRCVAPNIPPPKKKK